MSFFQKLRRNKQDKRASFPRPAANDDDGKRRVVMNQWNRLYYGFHGFDPSKPPSNQEKKKQKNVVLTPRDMDLIASCNYKIIADKNHEIYILKKTNQSLMRDHRYKDDDIGNLKREVRSLKKLYQRQLVESEYNEKEWATERKQLLQELESLRCTSAPPQIDSSMEALEDDRGDIEEELHANDTIRVRRGRSYSSSSSSVRDLIDEKEAAIQKYNHESGRYEA